MITLLLKIVYIAVHVIEGLLAIRFILEVLGANITNSFVQSVFEYSDPFRKPFDGVITQKFDLFGFSIDANTIIAILFYMVLGYMILNLIKAFRSEG